MDHSAFSIVKLGSCKTANKYLIGQHLQQLYDQKKCIRWVGRQLDCKLKATSFIVNFKLPLSINKTHYIITFGKTSTLAMGIPPIGGACKSKNRMHNDRSLKTDDMDHSNMIYQIGLRLYGSRQLAKSWRVGVTSQLTIMSIQNIKGPPSGGA